MTVDQSDPLGPPRIEARVAGPASDVVAELAEAGVATVHEAFLRRGLLRGLRPLDPAHRIAGPAVTALCHAGDNLMLHAAIDQCRPGDVLVVATLAPSEHGMFGDLLATLCQARGVAGLVIDAAVRDSQDIRAAGFPVWSRAISAAGTTKQTAGWVNIPVVCGGITISPGDVVCADADGVVAVPSATTEAVRDASRIRLANEEGIRARYATGIGKAIDDLLTAAGVVFDSTTPPHRRADAATPPDAIETTRPKEALT